MCRLPTALAFILGALIGLSIRAAQAQAPAPSLEGVDASGNLGLEDYRRHALLREGSAARGRQFFAEPERTGCLRCHSVDVTARKAGPDLFAIGDKLGRREIIDAVLAPSATIAVGYSATKVETRAGDEYTGVLKQVTDAWIELMGADGLPVRVNTVDIRAQTTSEVSLMPEGLHAALSPGEFTDLIEYLVSLKQPENTAALHHGMPAVIPALANPIALEPIHPDHLRFEHPVWFGPVPGQSNVFLVVEHETGRIWRFAPDASGGAKTVFAETGAYQNGTRGLLGLALHPQFATNRRCFIAKHAVENGRFATLILELVADAGFERDSGQPPRLLLRLDEATNVHYGGGLAFGPDGFFYIGMGDSGPQEDPQGHAQNARLFLGKLLRLDVDRRAGASPYTIPLDNPFIGRAGVLPEIWALGLREPWRFSFDPLTGDLWVGDVGQDRYEEVHIVRAGENCGWNVYEGFEPFSNRFRTEGALYVPPVFAYARKFGPSVTGGYVFRADPRSSFWGVYVCGDYESRRIFGLTQEGRVLKRVRQIGLAPQRIVSFGQGNHGELFLVGYEGTIYRLGFDQTVFE